MISKLDLANSSNSNNQPSDTPSSSGHGLVPVLSATVVPAITASSTLTKPPANTKPHRRQKTWNLDTYKIHALGDYVETIRLYGTTDSYSTELVS